VDVVRSLTRSLVGDGKPLVRNDEAERLANCIGQHS
jgi:hypothetical protein